MGQAFLRRASWNCKGEHAGISKRTKQMSKSGMEHFVLFESEKVVPCAAEVAATLEGLQVIRYYRRDTYGMEREYVHPSCGIKRDILQRLTGQRTIDATIRKLVTDLSGGSIVFVEVLAP
jgi:hypothetical protein